ncbi:MAG: nucleotidyltransferase family protein [Planctomycetes bacterium]|nr:nucleotidyltransferase family protein [Planctomycetota bacterium]
MPGWDLLLRQLRRTRLHPRLAVQLHEAGLVDSLPPEVRPHIEAGCVMAEAQERSTRWEVDRIGAALRDVDAAVVLLKGAAYVMAALPLARGRLTSDVDFMVAKPRLDEVEAALLAHGWEAMKVDAYDQQYYRRWMHELPPLCHARRETVVDVHHTILPETARFRPDAGLLLASATPLDGASNLRLLCPEDLFLHAATHLFCDAIENSLRDLVDLADLLAHFSRDEAFGRRLVERARALDLVRPLFYALRYTERLLGQPPPAGTEALPAPGPLNLRLMDRYVTAALLPEHPDEPTSAAGRARFALFVRSHWLRMPPLLLARHLATKAGRRLFPPRDPLA